MYLWYNKATVLWWGKVLRNLCFAGLFALIAHSVCANTIRDMSNNDIAVGMEGVGVDVGTLDTVIEDGFNRDFAALEEKMKRIAPRIVAENAGKSEFERMHAYREYVMHETYNLFKEKIEEHFLELSKQTGRSIKKYGPNNSIVTADGISGDGVYWLDRGVLDQSECQILYNGEPSGYFSCSYPDDYREVQLSYMDDGVFLELDVEQDGKKQHVMVFVFGQEDDSGSFLDYSVQTADYDDYYRYWTEYNKYFQSEKADILEVDSAQRMIDRMLQPCALGELECERTVPKLYDVLVEGKIYNHVGQM